MNLDFYKNRAENSRFSTQFLEYDEYVFDMIQDCFFRLNLNEKVEYVAVWNFAFPLHDSNPFLWRDWLNVWRLIHARTHL